MATYSIKLNIAEIEREKTRALGRSPLVKELAFKQFGKSFAILKAQMMMAFNNSKVTQEIEGGPVASDISGATKGYGNLFSFLGFNSSDRPTEPVRDLLEKMTFFRQTVYRNRGWYFQVTAPSMSDINSVAPMTWENGNSWVKAVENGISNLSFYMYREAESSRSGTGLQLEHPYTKLGRSNKVPYLTPILKEFWARIKG